LLETMQDCIKNKAQPNKRMFLKIFMVLVFS